MLGLMALRFAMDGETPSQLRAAICIYYTSGSTILACVLAAVVSSLLPASVNAHWPLLFIVEAIAVFAFGLSWFVKGQTMERILSRQVKTRPPLTPMI